MGLSRRFALFLVAPTAVGVLPFIVGLRGPAQCTRFDRDAVVEAREGATMHAHPTPNPNPSPIPIPNHTP